MLIILKKEISVFLSHRNHGIVAAGEVLSPAKEEYNKDLEDGEGYLEVKWLTRVPTKEEGVTRYLPFSKVTELLEHGFFWARTLKAPYLTNEESKLLLGELQKMTG